MDATFVFDVTELMQRARWGQRPTGIPRVQLEAAVIMAESPFRVAFCMFNRDRGVYERVAASTVLPMAERMRGRGRRQRDPAATAGSKQVARELAKLATRGFVATNGSSLPESGEGLTELLDPFERADWKNCIMRFWTDRDSLAARELEIKRDHTPVTGRDATRVLLGL